MKKIKWLIWVLVIAAAGIAVWYWKFREENTTLVLNTEQPVMGTISTTITATGTVQPVDTVAVGSQVSGTITRVFVDFNSTVKKGQLLAQMDKSLLQAQVQQINAQLQQAKSNLTYQQSNFERQDKLFKVGAISKAEQETALFQYNSGKDNVNSVAAQLTSAQRNLSFTDIYSPIDGTVLSRSISEGQTVASSFNTPTLFSIAKDLTKMQVRASVDEADIGNVGKGQRVTFTVDAFPDDTFAGIVKDIRLQPATSSNVVTYTTIIDAPNGDLKLKPGMTASINIFTKEVKDALLVPNSAFQFKPDSVVKEVYTVQGGSGKGGDRKKGEAEGDGSGRLAAPPPSSTDSASAIAGKPAVVWIKQDTNLVMRRVVTGMTNETERQVISGLTTNDIVVTGYQQLTKEQKKKAATSPFMPARRNNNRGGSGGGGTGGGGNRPR